MDTVRVGRDTRLEEDKKRNEPCFRCNKSGHTTEECEAYSSFNKRSGYTFERAIPRDLLRQDYVVPGPGSYDVDVSSFKLLNDQNRKRNSPDESKRRSSDSHIIHEKHCDERLWSEKAVEESSFWMTFQFANMPPYFRHAIEMWFQDSWQNTERRKLKRHFRAWRKIHRVSKMKQKQEMERRLKRASIRMRKKIEEARKKKEERKKSIMQQKHHNGKLASLYRAFQGTRSMLGGLEDYQNETIIRKSSELLECLKHTIVLNHDDEKKDISTLPVGIKKKSQKELDDVFGERADALMKNRSDLDNILLRDIKSAVRRSRVRPATTHKMNVSSPSATSSSLVNETSRGKSSSRSKSHSSNSAFGYLMGLLE